MRRSFMFNTGDLGRWSKEGKLEHHGRIDDQVKIKVSISSVSLGIDVNTVHAIALQT